ncbi:MAG: ABC transporter ATP-binding protein [Acetobacteraceae bacterium]
MTLTIHPGQCVALVGESGSGKSLTARSLLGLAGRGAVVTARRFRLHGNNALDFREEDWRAMRGKRIGLVLQDALVSLDPLRTVGDEVAEPLLHHRLARPGHDVRMRVHDVLAAVGMPDPAQRARQHAHQLSGGLRQRALIASAIAAGPSLIIADEPTTALDVTVQAQVLALLASRVKAGAGLLLISHDLALVAAVADHVHVMQRGVVVESGPVADVLHRPAHAYTRRLLAAIPSARSRGRLLSTAEPPMAGRAWHEALPARQAAMAEPVLEVTGVTKRYPARGDAMGFTALENVSFVLRRGEVLGIMGESGSGKTTCAKIVLGLLRPDAGAVRFLGAPWSAASEVDRRVLRPRMQYVPQDALSSFDPRHRVADIIGENLRGASYSSRSRDAAVARLLEQVGLDGRLLSRHPRALSGGQRQRVAIARALASSPALIVCDEPVSALDVGVQAQVLDLIAGLQRRLGTALLFISHDLGVIEHVSDRVMVVRDGRVVEEGLTETVFAAPQHDYTRTLLAARPSLALDLGVAA